MPAPLPYEFRLFDVGDRPSLNTSRKPCGLRQNSSSNGAIAELPAVMFQLVWNNPLSHVSDWTFEADMSRPSKYRPLDSRGPRPMSSTYKCRMVSRPAILLLMPFCLNSGSYQARASLSGLD